MAYPTSSFLGGFLNSLQALIQPTMSVAVQRNQPCADGVVNNVTLLGHTVVVPNVDFDVESHNEDFHFSRLAAGFAKVAGRYIPIQNSDRDLEALLFPNFYPYGRGHWVC